jgi:hypothetical protein
MCIVCFIIFLLLASSNSRILLCFLLYQTYVEQFYIFLHFIMWYLCIVLIMCLEYIDISPDSIFIKQYQICLYNISHVYIIINIFNLWVPLVEKELHTLPERLNSPPVFSGVRVTQSFVLYVIFCRALFVLFLLAIVLFVLLRFTDSNYPFYIFKLFFTPTFVLPFHTHF